VVVIPAIDILGGRCVRLVRGDFDHPKVYSDDPAEVAADFASAGADRIHIVDLDAARGSGDNKGLIQSILQGQAIKVQVAGGIRTAETVDSWLDAGAHAVIMGTVAVRDPRLLERCARRHPTRVLAALDVQNDKSAVWGWSETEPIVEHYRAVLLPLREKAVQLSQLQYNAMQIGLHQLLAAKQAQVNASREYIEAIRDYWTGRAELERAPHGLLELA